MDSRSSEQFGAFISYSRKDENYVKKLTEALEGRKIPYWIDNSIDYGTTWTKEIEAALKKCEVYILVMTPDSFESRWVQCELATALEEDKEIFPLLLKGEIWFPVKSIQCSNVMGGKLPPNDFFQRILEALCLSLQSARGVDYKKLRDLLEANDWKEADYETYLRMLEVCGRKEGDYCRPKELQNFPCTDLKTINNLWTYYSGKRFGFSVQKKIYQGLGQGDDDVVQKFAYHVGWIVDDGWTFDLDIWDTPSIQWAPVGQLPTWRVCGVVNYGVDVDSGGFVKGRWGGKMEEMTKAFYGFHIEAMIPYLAWRLKKCNI